MKQKILFVSESLICCLFLSACGDSALFTPPERGGENVREPTAADSVITLVADIPYSVLTRIAEKKLPQSMPIGGDGHIACLDIPYVNPGHVGSHEECINKPYVDFRGVGTERVCVQFPDFTGPSIGMRNQCADYHWHANINMEGGTHISRNGKFLSLSQGIYVTGQAGVGGTLADILSLRGKNIDIHATPRVNVGATLDRQWCPVISAAPLGSWINDASVEVVGRNCVRIDLGALGHPEICGGPVNLGLANELNHEFDRHRDELQRAAQDALPCDAFKPRIASQWHPLAIKIERKNLQPVYLNIQPKSAAFSGIVPLDDRLRVAVRVAAQTLLAANPADTAAQPLPTLNPLNEDRGSLQVNLQAIASYDLLKEQLHQAIANQTFEKEVPGGKIEVRIADVDVYPSKDSLALGLKINAKVPGRWFNTTGWVYLSGKPTVGANGRAVKVENVQFAEVIDSAFWSTASSLFQGEILKALNARANFDLGKEIDKAANEISQAIAKDDVPGLKIAAGTPNLSFESIYVTSPALIVGCKLAMTIDAEVTESILK
ncbi:DUF4403 family protein [uncultured Rhodoblastus sp.]|uniref:DUF4403 family protein n=1 Tax=uncultured Rhodoblastus sp. TaxID=543037 RepID=UPI0025E1E042|nr:DUF4403 family protein [uncultured Rhodoblastus sp.]